MAPPPIQVQAISESLKQTEKSSNKEAQVWEKSGTMLTRRSNMSANSDTSFRCTGARNRTGTSSKSFFKRGQGSGKTVRRKVSKSRDWQEKKTIEHKGQGANFLHNRLVNF